MSGRPKAIIVGGGIAGPAAALALREVGVDAAVYEARGANGPDGGGLSLAPNGMNVLARLGLAERVRAAGSVVRDCCYRNHRGRRLAAHPYGRAEKYGQPTVIVTRAALHGVLSGALVDRNIPVHYDKRLTGVADTTDGRVVATFADGSTAEGDFLVGADGIQSAVRRAVFPGGPEPEFVGLIGYGGVVPAVMASPPDPDDRGRLNCTFGPDGFFGYCNIGEDPLTWMWWVNVARDEPLSRDELRAPFSAAERQSLLARFSGWCPPTGAFIRASEDVLRVNIFDVQYLPTWSKGRTLLIGDAAHAMSPNSGLGASIALEDALYLVHLMGESRAGLKDVFRRFEADRRGRVEKINTEARKMAANKKPLGRVAVRLRDAFLSLAMPWIGERSLDWKFRYRVPGAAGR
ncbi:FAD-dependent oxidoreductase [Fimbriiglobus ruber]|uniref:Salicylate hydroxylase n=1 Tax=Fimbriiglobus ruber TaxID=1908690 RepID=A0A225DJQ7_9BACT|nr:NAD(P)/FAD-dependent oxidoreductase [Fimbriiglobus ruber]OWK41691.1 Salicylate hydroxylase [Fimbriiglobus ruber]